MKKIDYLILLFALIILIGSFFLIHYYFTMKSNQCLANPLVYGANEISQQYGYDFTGYGFLLIPKTSQSLTFTFNKTNLTIGK